MVPASCLWNALIVHWSPDWVLQLKPPSKSLCCESIETYYFFPFAMGNIENKSYSLDSRGYNPHTCNIFLTIAFCCYNISYRLFKGPFNGIVKHLPPTFPLVDLCCHLLSFIIWTWKLWSSLLVPLYTTSLSTLWIAFEHWTFCCFVWIVFCKWTWWYSWAKTTSLMLCGSWFNVISH